MLKLQRTPEEPVQFRSDRTGSFASGALSGAIAIAHAWAGSSCRGLLLSGSHASGEAVWVECDGRAVSLSDVDLYAVLPGPRECRDAEARARALRPGRARCISELALAAPLEVAFLTVRDLESLPPRPATLELERHGRLIDGDPELPRHLPHWEPRDVPFEETLLLLENRGFELLASRARLEGDALERLSARHAVLKCAGDLAGVMALLEGEYPDGVAARIAWARGQAAAPDQGLAALWETALAWRHAPAAWSSKSAALDEWRSAVRAWTALWNRVTLSRVPEQADPMRRALAIAARARPRRRLRHALGFKTRSARGPSAWKRWRYAARGTPQHRLNASAAVLLLAALEGPDGPQLSPSARAILGRLGAVVLPRGASFERAAAAAVRLWDEWILDGQRTAEPE